MRFEYPATVTRDKQGRYVVEFLDIPGLRVRGKDQTDAYLKAQGSLSRTLIFNFIATKKIFPRPSPVQRKHIGVPLLLLTATKLALNQAVQKRKLSNAALANRLGVSEVAVRRLLDPDHQSKLSRLQRALDLIGVPVMIDAECMD